MALSQQVMRELKEAFFLFDYDRDGKVTVKEIKGVVRSAGLDATEAQFGEIIREVERMPGGLIDANTLVQIIQQKNLKPCTEGELMDSFSIFDKQGTGQINLAEFKQSVTMLGERLTDEEADALIREADRNADGQCDFKDIIGILMGTR